MKPANSKIRYTAVKMDPDLYRKVKLKARAKYQSFSEYIRQLIVADLEAPDKQSQK